MSYATFARKESDAPALQSKAVPTSVSGGLRIGDPNDAYEQEADRVADELMAGGRVKRHWSLPSPGGGASLQRKCSCGESGGSGGECEECKREKEDTTLQRKAVGFAESSVAPPIVREVLNSPGQQMDTATRAFMEPRLGRDFSKVRVHTDARAAESARVVNALAYTIGQDIMFAHGQYRPATTIGRQLLAHELTHVVQQSVVSHAPSADRLTIDPHGSVAEQEAERIAGRVVMDGALIPVAQRRYLRPSALRTIQRQPEEKAEPTVSLGAPFQGHGARMVAAFDSDPKGRGERMTVTKLLRILEPYLLKEPRARYRFLGRVPEGAKDPDEAKNSALKRADLWRRAILAMIDTKRWPERWFEVAFTSGKEEDPEVEVWVDYAGTTTGLGRLLQPEPTPSGVSAKFKPPLTVIVKVGDKEIFKVAVPKEAKLSTPPLGGAREIVISMSGSINEDLIKLLKPEEGPPAPGKPGPPISAGLQVSVRTGRNVSTKLSGTYDLKSRRLTTGLSFSVTTPYGECALPSGAAQGIVDAVKKLKAFGVTSVAEVGGHPMVAPPKPGESPFVPGKAPSLEATEVPEAAETIGEAVATLIDRMDAIKKATEQCKKGRKPLKVEVGPKLVLPVGEQLPTEPPAPSVGVGVAIFFE